MTPSPDAVASARRRARSMRWALGVGAAAFTAIGLVLIFLLAQATNNRTLYEHYYTRLFGLNVVVAAFLLLVIGWVAFRLLQRLRQGKFGSRLLLRLAAIFAFVGVVPGALVYVVSYQFVSRSIESWFDVKVEGALTAGVTLAQATLDSLTADVSNKARAASDQFEGISDAGAGLVLERIREQLGASDAVLWGDSGQLIANVGASRFRLDPERPSAQQLRQTRAERSIAFIDGLVDDDTPALTPNAPAASIHALVLVRRPGFDLGSESRYLQVVVPLPPVVVSNALAVTKANREYQERSYARAGLLRMYIGTLTLSLFLAVFGAVLLAVLFGTQLARPLLVLADGVRQVAAGDLRPTVVLPGKDELGGLTRSFAVMTQQLAEARGAVEKTVGQLDAARASLQTILDNLTSGVIVLDHSGTVLSTNPGATRVLRAPLAAYEGQPLALVPGLETFADNVQQQFDDFQVERAQHGLDHWQHAFELQAPGDGATQTERISLVARGAELPGGNTRLLVFDDISEIVSAQRAQAWGEVARRLAHEIKNPLTPIQLSAERLQLKLEGKLEGAEQALLTKSVKTIVDQVDAMKRLVNEFRDYARLPAADLKPVDLNALINDLLHLYSADHARIPVHAELDPRCPPIRGDAQQLRQIIHNLLQNAQDATESITPPDGRPRGSVLIHTSLGKSGERVRMTVQDSGHGFAEHILKRAFEPYVTTKTKGTGLGLAVVKKIADEHGARIELSNRLEGDTVAGAQVSLSFAVAASQPAAASPLSAENH